MACRIPHKPPVCTVHTASTGTRRQPPITPHSNLGVVWGLATWTLQAPGPTCGICDSIRRCKRIDHASAQQQVIGKEIRCPMNAVTGPQNHSHSSCPSSQESFVPAGHALQPLLQQCLATFCCNNHTRGGLGRWHQQEAATKRQEQLGRYPSQTCHATPQLKPVMQQHSCWTCHATTRSHLPRNNTGCHSTLLNFPVAPSYAACAAQPKPSQTDMP
jgi:hypothetical protein